MIYYKHHIGDHAKRTMYLGMAGQGAYRMLLDSYYASESALPLDKESLYGITRAASRADKAIVDGIMQKLFVRLDDGYHDPEIDEAIAAYKAKSITNRGIARAREAARKEHESCTKRATNDTKNVEPIHYPLSINQEPLTTKTLKPKTHTVLCPLNLPTEVWKDYIALRAVKKSPLTPTALQGLEREAERAGMSLESVLRTCCERGWIGFKAEWMAQNTRKFNGIANSANEFATAEALLFNNQNELDVTDEASRIQ